MRIKIGYELAIEVPAPTSLVLMLNVHHERVGDLETPDGIHFSPGVSPHLYRDLFGNLCVRLVAPAGTLTFKSEAVIRDSGEPELWPVHATGTPVEQIPDDALGYLMPSRYCEVDQMMGLAWDTFGKFAPGWPRVREVMNFVHGHLEFDYQRANPLRTAMMAYKDGVGVCRDFMHLAITLCRCLNIPARYATGYLGDIGVPPVPCPMDFSAYFEVYLDNRWWALDARHNKPRIGRVLQARGRDAADVAFITTFGPHTLRKFFVVTDEIKP
jgi:transglutaminase-like putative cysteine protease